MVVQNAQLLPCQQELAMHGHQEGWGQTRLGLQQSKSLLSPKATGCCHVGGWSLGTSEAVRLAVAAYRLAWLVCHDFLYIAERMTSLNSDAGPPHVMCDREHR